MGMVRLSFCLSFVTRIDPFVSNKWIAEQFLALRDPGAMAVVDLLRSTSCAITDLNVGCNEIWEEGGKALGEVLKVNKSVKKKGLSGFLIVLVAIFGIGCW